MILTFLTGFGELLPSTIFKVKSSRSNLPKAVLVKVVSIVTAPFIWLLFCN
jgi:CBS domain containing-hemolysin-like protein